MCRNLLVLIFLSGCPCSWACSETREEVQIKEYVARRNKVVSDGTLAKQISQGTYTADSLSLEMYEWWVQLGLANHGAAIDNFVAMITDAGTPQQKPPSKDWSPIVQSWAWPILSMASAVTPMVNSLFGIIYLGVLTYQTAALAAADPSQDGSTDFLKAAQNWRAALPSQHTSHLLMVHDFINDLKTTDTQKRLLPAYELVTKLIESTKSYRNVFNSYYAAYMKSVVPHSSFYMAAMVSQDIFPWSQPEVTLRALWTPAPIGLDGCVIKQSVMQANAGCLDASTPVLGTNFTIKALLINRAFDKTGFNTWKAYEFACNNIVADLRTSQTGCVDSSGRHYEPGEKDSGGYIACTNRRLDMDLKTTVFQQLRAACAGTISSSTKVATYNYENITGKEDYYDLTKFGSKSYFHDHTCKDGSALLIV